MHSQADYAQHSIATQCIASDASLSDTMQCSAAQLCMHRPGGPMHYTSEQACVA